MRCAMHKMKKSFTLIELLIVIVIIGVIMTLAVPRYRLLVINARGAEAKKTLRAIADSVWRYYLESGNFPPTNVVPSEIPSVLDITLPTDQTQNFDYQYFTSSDITRLFAWDYDAYFNGPVGSVVAYGVYYDDTPTMNGQPGHKMDETWYRYYLHLFKTGSEGELRMGWP